MIPSSKKKVIPIILTCIYLVYIDKRYLLIQLNVKTVIVANFRIQISNVICIVVLELSQLELFEIHMWKLRKLHLIAHCYLFESTI